MKTFETYIYEMIGTFLLVFFGILSAVYSNENIYIVALTFGFVVFITILLIGDKTGAHINPAVTINFYLRKKISFRTSVFYIAFQLLGSLFASLLLFVILKDKNTLGANKVIIFDNSLWGIILFGIIVEAFLVCILIWTIHLISLKSLYFKAISIGITITILILIGFYLTGASLNPARSIFPAIIEKGNALNHLSIYIIGPILGAMISAFIIRKKEVKNERKY
ncbi:MIP/aquaporin family protein [Acholeplasma granularum]|uniref:MIP/aquaporin family protein n=1 Tax=Acholeplasma granularum TaxID=264635 RepID=UPI00046E97A7|nr:aquaporin [Acholeplasma granularum]